MKKTSPPFTKMAANILYYQQEYMECQQFEHLQSFRDNHCEIHFSVDDHCAISLQKSPFGSFFTHGISATDFQRFESEMAHALRKENVHRIVVNHPPAYYSAVPAEWLADAGYSIHHSDIGQYLPLDRRIEEGLHPMQLRKLKKADKEGMGFKKAVPGETAAIYRFIARCREAQGLVINITLEKLKGLFHLFPGQYEAFVAERQGVLTAAAIMVIPAPGIVYYYLPATHPEHKSSSPMVYLLKKIHDHYRERDYKILDLGVSSIQGKKQNGLFTFKERMGAFPADRITFQKEL